MRVNVKQLNGITELWNLEKIKTNIDKVFPLKDVLNVDIGRTKGKVIIKNK